MTVPVIVTETTRQETETEIEEIDRDEDRDEDEMGWDGMGWDPWVGIHGRRRQKDKSAHQITLFVIR